MGPMYNMSDQLFGYLKNPYEITARLRGVLEGGGATDFPTNAHELMLHALAERKFVKGTTSRILSDALSDFLIRRKLGNWGRLPSKSKLPKQFQKLL